MLAVHGRALPHRLGLRLATARALHGLPYSANTNILYAASREQADTLVQAHILNHPRWPSMALGLDVEWNTVDPASGRPRTPFVPALIQLSSGHVTLLLHTWLFEDARKLPTTLQHVLEHPRAIKAGCAIHGDATILKRSYSISPRAFVDTQRVAAECGLGSRKQPVGMARLATMVNGLQVDKDRHVARSNWEQPLGGDQVQQLDPHALPPGTTANADVRASSQ